MLLNLASVCTIQLSFGLAGKVVARRNLSPPCLRILLSACRLVPSSCRPPVSLARFVSMKIVFRLTRGLRKRGMRLIED